MKIKTMLIIAVILIAILGTWGIVGGIVSDDPGINCDVGIGDGLCWKWSKNLVGQAQEFLNDVGEATSN